MKLTAYGHDGRRPQLMRGVGPTGGEAIGDSHLSLYAWSRTGDLEDALGLGAVGLVASHVGPDVMRREQDHAVSERLELAAPVMRPPTRFHDHRRLRLLCHGGQELRALQTLPTGHVSSSI